MSLFSKHVIYNMCLLNSNFQRIIYTLSRIYQVHPIGVKAGITRDKTYIYIYIYISTRQKSSGKSGFSESGSLRLFPFTVSGHIAIYMVG